MEFGFYAPPEMEPIALVLEIIREGNKELSYLNRYCQNPRTKVSLPCQFPSAIPVHDILLDVTVARQFLGANPLARVNCRKWYITAKLQKTINWLSIKVEKMESLSPRQRLVLTTKATQISISFLKRITKIPQNTQDLPSIPIITPQTPRQMALPS